jgi:hypothetical protein
MAEVDDNSRNLTAEYGLSYHVVEGTDNNNGSSGSFTSKLGPYWKGIWSHRLSEKWGYRLSYKVQLVEFNDIEGDATIKKEEVALNTAEFGVSWMQTPIRRMTIFIRSRDHILYRAKDNNVFELIKHGFIEPGVEVAWGSRRRVGPQINFALQGYGLQPTSTSQIETGSGLGAEAAIRLGWVTPMGVTVMVKGFYDYATSPNATLDFAHEEFGYALQMTYSF